MTQIEAKVPWTTVEIEGGVEKEIPKYGDRDGIEFDGHYTGDGKPVIRFRVGRKADGNKFAGDLASDPEVDILGRSDR